ncbi:MAG: site-specific DNA-methyltransferase [Phycisphaerae bacterium]
MARKNQTERRTDSFSDHQIIRDDCIQRMGGWPANCVDLVFADPPFNIGYRYDGYDDAKRYEDYVNWSRDWMAACVRVLKPTGSFYIAIGDAYAAELRLIGRELGLTLRNWIIWHYSFGQNMRSRFALAHTHILYFTRDPKRFTFNDVPVRYPSARHTEYSDRRAHPLGRVPDDVWNEYPRVCGTFKERQGWHGCQMPEALLVRIIRAASNPGDVVLDPFVGSGTTTSAAARLGRIAVGIDQSEEYAAEAERRLRDVMSLAEASRTENANEWTDWERDCLRQLYRETDTPRESLVANRVAMTCFKECLAERIDGTHSVAKITVELERLDKNAELPRFKNDRPFRARVRRGAEHAPDRKLKESWYVGLPNTVKAGNERAVAQLSTSAAEGAAGNGRRRKRRA